LINFFLGAGGPSSDVVVAVLVSSAEEDEDVINRLSSLTSTKK